MPNRVAVDEGVKCSYFSICDLDDVIAASESCFAKMANASYMVNIHVNASTLTTSYKDLMLQYRYVLLFCSAT